MIQPHFSHAHYCKNGHLNTSNQAKIPRCEALIPANRDDAHHDLGGDVIYDNQKGAYFKKCNLPIEKTYILPTTLDFSQPYSREIFDGIMNGHSLKQFFFEVHSNIAQIHLALDDISKALRIKLNNVGSKRGKK